MTQEFHNSLPNCLQRLPDEDNTGVQNACGQHCRQTWHVRFYHGCAILYATLVQLQVQCSACSTAVLSAVTDREKRRRKEGYGGGGGEVENDDLRLQPID